MSKQATSKAKNSESVFNDRKILLKNLVKDTFPSLRQYYLRCENHPARLSDYANKKIKDDIYSGLQYLAKYLKNKPHKNHSFDPMLQCIDDELIAKKKTSNKIIFSEDEKDWVRKCFRLSIDELKEISDLLSQDYSMATVQGFCEYLENFKSYFRTVEITPSLFLDHFSNLKVICIGSSILCNDGLQYYQGDFSIDSVEVGACLFVRAANEFMGTSINPDSQS